MKGFVFDLDNTLYDRYATLEKILRDDFDAVKKYINPAYDASRAVCHFNTIEALYILNGWADIYKELVKSHFFNIDNTPTKEQLVDYVMDRFTKVAVPHPYVKDVLKTIKDSGYKLALMSNHYSRDIQYAKIDLLGIRDMFDEIVISGEVAQKLTGDANNTQYYKPNPDLFLYTADLLGERPCDLYYVGDNPRCDVRGAETSGFVPVWIKSRSPWPYANEEMPKLSFDTVKEVIMLL